MSIRWKRSLEKLIITLRFGEVVITIDIPPEGPLGPSSRSRERRGTLSSEFLFYLGSSFQQFSLLGSRGSLSPD